MSTETEEMRRKYQQKADETGKEVWWRGERFAPGAPLVPVRTEAEVILSTGDIREDYDVLDTIFAFDGQPASFGEGVNPSIIFDSVKAKLRSTCVTVGGTAVVFCRFEYRDAHAFGGLLGSKSVFELFAYGTAVRSRPAKPDNAPPDVTVAQR